MPRRLSSTLVFASLVLVAAPAQASSYYQAQPAVVPAGGKLVLRDVIWNCGDANCVAGKSNSRPAIVCAVLAKHVGPIRTFSIAGSALSAAQLEQCNARVAKRIATQEPGQGAVNTAED